MRATRVLSLFFFDGEVLTETRFSRTQKGRPESVLFGGGVIVFIITNILFCLFNRRFYIVYAIWYLLLLKCLSTKIYVTTILTL